MPPALAPSIQRLPSSSESGLAEAREVEQTKRPDKKVYAITEAGRHAFRKALSGRPGPDRMRSDFLFSMFFAEEMPSQQVEAALVARIDWYRESLARIDDCAADECRPARPGGAFVRGLGQAVYEAALHYLLENRDQLLAELTSRESERSQTKQSVAPDAAYPESGLTYQRGP